MKPEPQYSSTRRKIFDLHPKNLFLSLGMVFVIALSVMGSLLFGRFIDLLITKQSFDTATQLHLVALLATLLAAAILNVFLSQYLPLKVQLSRSIDKVNEVMSALMRVPYKFYSQNEKGYYINLITSSAFTYGDLYGHINIQLIANGICVALILGVSYLIHPVFLGVYIAYIPLYALLSHKPNNAIANFQKVGLPTQDKFLSATKKIRRKRSRSIWPRQKSIFCVCTMPRAINISSSYKSINSFLFSHPISRLYCPMCLSFS